MLFIDITLRRNDAVPELFIKQGLNQNTHTGALVIELREGAAITGGRQ